MLEWFKRHAWKACVLQKGTGGSNPFLSAKRPQKLVKARKINDLRAFTLLRTSKIFNKNQTFGDLFGYPKILKFRVTEFAQNTFIIK